MQPGMAIGVKQSAQRILQGWSDVRLLGFTRSNENRTVFENTSANAAAMTLHGRRTGKLYWELAVSASGAFNMAAGIRREDESINTAINLGKTCAMRSNATVFAGDTGASTGTPASFSSPDVLILALDVLAQKLWIGVNGTWANSGNPAAGTGALFSGFPDGIWFPYIWIDNDTGNHTITFNSGHAAYSHTRPDGFDNFTY